MRKDKEENKCPDCYGFGIWAIGDNCPMGLLDFLDSSPVKICKSCGSGNHRDYWGTLEGRIIYKKNLSNSHLKNIVKHLNERKEGKTRVRKMIENEIKRRNI